MMDRAGEAADLGFKAHPHMLRAATSRARLMRHRFGHGDPIDQAAGDIADKAKSISTSGTIRGI
jgi:hypothetical protein